MMDITQINTEALLRDKDECFLDITTCEAALKLGIHQYSGGSTQERLDVNRKIVIKIQDEINRRRKEVSDE